MVLLHSVAEEEGGGRYEEKRGGDGIEPTCFDYLNRAPSISLISNTVTSYTHKCKRLVHLVLVFRVWFRKKQSIQEIEIYQATEVPIDTVVAVIKC